MLKSIGHTVPRGLVGGFALAAAALTGGCDNPAVPLEPATLTISPGNAALEDVTESLQLTATVTDQKGGTMTDVTVHYVSSDENIVSVNSRGLVRAKEEGMAQVWGFVDDLVDTVAISVKLGPRGVLIRIYNALSGPDWNSDTNWGTTQPLDSWYGVGTDAAGNVTQLSLSGNGLVGFIAPEIGRLEHLEELTLSSNDSLGGTIPPEIGNLRNLVSLNLESTAVRGAIPPEIGNLQRLTELLLESPDYSPGTLRGPLPPELGNLVRLEVLDLRGNEFSGPIPPELGNLRSLRQLTLQTNALRGSVPAELGNLQNLTSLRIGANPLSGQLPAELTTLTIRRFHWFGTNLCAPVDDDFKAWLASINDHRGGDDCVQG